MVQTWKSAPGPDHTCPHCGAVYAVTLQRFPVRERDKANWQVCGEVMAEWDSTTQRTFVLIARGGDEILNG